MEGVSENEIKKILTFENPNPMNHAVQILTGEIFRLEQQIADFKNYQSSESLIALYQDRAEACREAIGLIFSHLGEQQPTQEKIKEYRALIQEIGDLC